MAQDEGGAGETPAAGTHAASAGDAAGRAEARIDPELAAKVGALRATLREGFGKAVMAMMMMPRYRSQMLADLQHLVLEPMIKDRLAFAYPKAEEGAPPPDMAGFAIWASVPPEVDVRIREQIAAGVFPVRLRPEDWDGGEINWLLDVVAQDRETVHRVITGFRHVAKEGELHLHPLISRLADPETLEKMGARKGPRTAGEAEGSQT